MSKRSMLALINLIVWTVVTTMFLILFFTKDGPTNWGADSTKQIMSITLVATGFITFFIVQFKANKEPVDERVRLVQLKAANVTLVIVLVYVFVFGLTLYTIYNNELMPSSWIWLITFSTVFLTYITNSSLYIYFEKREIGYGS
ncbi:DUF2178 domain-containing protein [Mycoplasmatota bacterium WC30]